MNDQPAKVKGKIRIFLAFDCHKLLTRNVLVSPDFTKLYQHFTGHCLS